MKYALTHTMYKMRAPKSVGSPTWAAGRTGWDEVGVRLAQLRREQASNTNQGDLVMDIGPTEGALCSLMGLNQMPPSHTPQTYIQHPFSSLVIQNGDASFSAY